ncbi:ATP-binding protein [Actinorugispora endophytica]|uniref:Anti-sigma regulatory factor (Ser/Thr protein kinase) n=1 Tax=Actinorugispora endophytica TaxID=1605990 RepID=A0A4R6V3L8_9ACTN|nr:ATP-binding protein [Actinorugispora endophytica]TDQ53147.1 anti-sigma regulatory factor (Ser/Thr protein kinase) [Actinorugispora endophytica]
MEQATPRPEAVTLPPRRSGGGPVSVHLTSFPGVVESVAPARRFVTGVLRITPQITVPETVIDRAELITSELATNAVLHTLSGEPGQAFHVRVRVDAQGMRAEIRTRRPRHLHAVPRVADARPDAENGRGLFLVDALATRWGTLAPAENGVYYTLHWPRPLSLR